MLNTFGLERRSRTTGQGPALKTKDRYTITIKAEPMVHIFDARALGQGPAEAIVEHLRNRIRGISEVAKPATLAARQRAKDAYQRGEPWAKRRYAGGRTGGKEPGQTVRLFNDSGRLADGLFARPTRDNAWTVNVPANRFDPTTFSGGEGAMAEMVARLQQLVPEFGDAAKLSQVAEVRQAIADSVNEIWMRHGARSARRELRKAFRAGIREGWQWLRTDGLSILQEFVIAG